MNNYYLKFEEPIKSLDEQITSIDSRNDLTNEDINLLNDLKKKRVNIIDKIYSELSRWERIQLARHPDRPYSLDYIKYLSKGFIELHGDRYHMDDPAVVCGLGHLGEHKIVWIGQQKGRNTKENLYRNFGMMRPEGYRKALRVMKLAEKFSLPVVTLLDTIGAYPGIGAEERGQGEAIASNLFEMSKLKIPIVSVVIGEGASGGALGIGMCDKMLMMENTWYSVISPEGCASILFRDAKMAEEAAEALKPTPSDLVKVGICEKIIDEPNGGAHRDFESSAISLKNSIVDELEKLSNVDPSKFLERRIDKYYALGYFDG